MVLRTFSKAVLPIEAEMDDNSAADTGPCQYEDSEETEQLCFQMKKIKEAIDSKAITNIKNAQDRYKTRSIIPTMCVCCNISNLWFVSFLCMYFHM